MWIICNSVSADEANACTSDILPRKTGIRKCRNAGSSDRSALIALAFLLVIVVTFVHGIDAVPFPSLHTDDDDFHLLQTPLLLTLSSSPTPSVTSLLQQRPEAPKSVSLWKSHPSTGPFPHSPSNSASITRFSTNRPCPSNALKSECLGSNHPNSADNTNNNSNSSNNNKRREHLNHQGDNTNNNNYIDPSPLDMSPMLDTRSTGNEKASAAGVPHFPEPIVFKYTMYYPGNVPLVITAGHGGASRPGDPVNRKMTHRFKPIPDLDTFTRPIQVSMFAEPTTRMNNYGGSEEEEIMPWMPPRNQSTGGPVSNFKADLNTHAMALNLANAVACLTSIGRDGMESLGYDRITDVTRSSTDIPKECEGQGPWGDNDSDYPFPSSSAPPAPSATPTLSFASQVVLDSSPVNLKQEQPRQYQQQLNYPHVIVFRVKRLNVDVNRNLTGENAIAEEHPAAEAAWREYHDLIDHVKKMALQQRQYSHKPRSLQSRRQQQQNSWNIPRTTLSSTGDGLLLDIHGHAHATNLIEVGYLLNHTVLEMNDDAVDAHTPALAARSSIRALTTSLNLVSSHNHDYNQHRPQERTERIKFSKLIRGRTESLGGMLQTQGLSSVPSPENPAPCGGCIYFYGGYTIQRHGSRDANNINNKGDGNNNKEGECGIMDAIQLELPKTMRLVSNEGGREIGMKLGRAVVEYMAKYYGIFQGLGYENDSDTVATEAIEAETKMIDKVGTWAIARQYTRPSKVHDTLAETRENQSGDSDSDDVMVGGSITEMDSGARTGPVILMEKSTTGRRRPEVERRSSRL